MITLPHEQSRINHLEPPGLSSALDLALCEREYHLIEAERAAADYIRHMLSAGDATDRLIQAEASIPVEVEG